MQKKRNQFLYYILYPVHVIAWIGLLSYIITGQISWNHLGIFLIGWILIEGIGTAIMLHRYTSHRSFEVRSYLKPFLIWLSCMSLQGSPIGWAAVHRGSHHRYADTEKDAHSPIKGKWYAWHSWLRDWNDYFNPKYVVDLLRDSQQVWFAKHYEIIVVVSYIIIGLISFEILLFAFMLPAAIGLYQESNINVFCHSGDLGYRNFETKDRSRNIPLLALITWGQGWHNNHHQKPSSYDFGTSVSGRTEEFDPCMIIIPFIATPESYREILEKRKLGVQLHSQQSS